MKNLKALLVALSVLACSIAVAQEITTEEMMQLDKFRAEYKSRGLNLTAEQEVQLLQRLRAMRAMAGQAPTAAGTPTGLLEKIQQAQQRAGANSPPAPSAAPASINEEQLRQKLAGLPAGEPLTNVQFLSDGLSFNGRRFVDSMGRAERFGVDRDSGRAGYLVRNGQDATVRIVRLSATADPITIGTLRSRGNQQVFETATGKTLAGELFFPLADGALVLRDSVGFRYVAGEGVKQIDLPAGWFPTPAQAGNVSSTGWVLLEKDLTEQKRSQLPFVGLIKKIGEISGASEADEYALFDMQSGRMIVLDISADGKSITEGSHCRRRTAVVNVCDQMVTTQTAWERDGSPNWRHYFWRVSWEQVGGRPVAVVQEKRLVQVNAYDLSSGTKVNLFERGLGLTAMNPQITADGKLRVTARLGFDTATVDDVGERLRVAGSGEPAAAPKPQ